MLRRLRTFLKGVIDNPRLPLDLRLVRESPLFEPAWYLQGNPDIAQAAVDPALHYLRFGGFEGRDPGPRFSSRWYLAEYPDVRNAHINPLVHYLRFGRREGRSTGRAFVQSSPSYSDFEASGRRSVLPATRGSHRPKVFCIGYNKTGTTSMERALTDLGYTVGVQTEAERLMDDWAVRDFRRIVRYCETAEAFQDVPFSLDFTYQALDYAFPGSKYILTVRKNADEWYDSYMRFYKKLMRIEGKPTADHLKALVYVADGWLWRQEQNIFGIDESNVFDPKIYKAHYTEHNSQVTEFFKLRPSDLLVLDLADPSSMKSLCEFLGIPYAGQSMPHLNKSTG